MGIFSRFGIRSTEGPSGINPFDNVFIRSLWRLGPLLGKRVMDVWIFVLHPARLHGIHRSLWVHYLVSLMVCLDRWGMWGGFFIRCRDESVTKCPCMRGGFFLTAIGRSVSWRNFSPHEYFMMRAGLCQGNNYRVLGMLEMEFQQKYSRKMNKQFRFNPLWINLLTRTKEQLLT